MQINLKQNEIISAIKGYITNQGINLVGKNVTVTFTAGRKESGISAEVSIEDQVGNPQQAPVAQATATINVVEAGHHIQTVKPLAAPDSVFEDGSVEDAVLDVTAADVKTQSLFG